MLVRSDLMDTFVARCSTRYPELRERIEARGARWRQDNADALQAANAMRATLPEVSRTLLTRLGAGSAGMADTQIAVAEKYGDGKSFCTDGFTHFAEQNESGYIDASNYNRAAGQYYVRIVSADEFAKRCTAQYPELSAAIADATATWREQDAVVRRNTEAVLARARRVDPGMIAQLESQARAQSQLAFDSLAKFGDEKRAAFCLVYFNQLASVAWRAHTPRTYEFLENGPPAD
jgi:hypothetical protein